MAVRTVREVGLVKRYKRSRVMRFDEDRPPAEEGVEEGVEEEEAHAPSQGQVIPSQGRFLGGTTGQLPFGHQVLCQFVCITI